jgi:RNA polymerase sigma-70 factor (ECF subfamily)
MAEGDESAFAALYRRRQGAVYRFALHMSGSASVAEDVTQEVFLELMRDPAGYDPDRGALASYLYGMARNLVLRAGRGRGTGPVPAQEPSAGDLLADLTRKEAIEAVRRAVLSLPPRYREVVVLCDLEEMEYAGAAEALGCAVGTVRSRLHRARALLAGKLRPRLGTSHELSGV